MIYREDLTRCPFEKCFGIFCHSCFLNMVECPMCKNIILHDESSDESEEV